MNEPEIIHVIPLNDIKQHIEDIKCWCLPSLAILEGENKNPLGYKYIHYSLDGREFRLTTC